MAPLPMRLRAEERRELVRRLADRLGTGTAGGLALLATRAEKPSGERLEIAGESGAVRIRGHQEWTSLADGSARQEDAIRIDGLADLPAGLAVLVDEVRPSGAAPARARIGVEGTEKPPEGPERTALEEAFRFTGERFGAALTKGEAEVRLPPLAPLPEAEARAFLRGRWCLLPSSPKERWPHLASLAVVLHPKRSGAALLVRGIGSAVRAVVPIALIREDDDAAGFELARAADGRLLEKALAALALKVGCEAPSEPRPSHVPIAPAAPLPLETAGFVLGTAPVSTSGYMREAARGHGSKLAALDMELRSADGSSRGTLFERHLYGVSGEGTALAASFAQEGRTALLCAGPRGAISRWLNILEGELRA